MIFMINKAVMHIKKPFFLYVAIYILRDNAQEYLRNNKEKTNSKEVMMN